MKRFSIYAFALLLLAGNACRRVPEEEAAHDKLRLIWNDDPETTMTVAWDQEEAVANARVCYGREDHERAYWKYENQADPQRIHPYYEMNTHFTKLEGLEPGSVYYFIIQDDQGVSERYWFRTAPDQPESFTFVGGGDTKSADDPLEAGRASNRMVSKLRPLFVFFNGDFTSGNGTDAERWHQWLRDWHEMTTTEDGRMIPIVPVHGNHENGDYRNLNHIFNAPFQFGDTSRIYYSLSFGGDFFHIIAMNSELRSDSLQDGWLLEDLMAHQDHHFIIAGYHKPFWPHTSRKRENQRQYDRWAGLIHQYGVDVSFDADSHMDKITFPLRPDSSDDAFMGFIRDDETGILFVGEGSWGARPRANDDDKPWTLTSGSYNQFKWVHVHTEPEPYMEIHTVITASYDENEQQTLYDGNVQALTEENPFEIPAGINLREFRPGINSVKYPFHLNPDAIKN